MKRIVAYTILFSLFFYVFPFGQNLKAQSEEETLPVPNFATSDSNLLQTYLNSTLSIPELICELQIQARQDRDHGDVLKAIQKIQVALMLEKELQVPEQESFSLNVFAGQTMAENDLHFALEFYKKACEIVPYLEMPILADLFNLYTNRAGIHQKLAEPDTALYYFHKAIAVAKMTGQMAFVSSYNNLGVFLLNEEKYDSAKYYFELALQILADRNQSIMMFCAIQDNLAELAILENDYAAALKTYQFNDSVYIARNIPTKYAANQVRMMQAMEKLNRPGIEPMIYALDAYRKQQHHKLQAEVTLDFFRFAERYCFDKGNYALAKKFQQQYISWTDSVGQLTADRMHEMAQSLMAVQKASFQNELKANELTAEHTRMQLKSTRRLLITSLISAISIVAALVLYFRKRRQELHAQRFIAEALSREKEMEAKLVSQELDLKKKDLTNLVLHNTQVYDANQRIIDRLQQMHGSNGDTEKHIRSLLFDLQSQNQVSERSNLLLGNIESVNAEFFEKLKIKYPELTKAEAELCGYIRINLSSKDIAILKNIEAASVKMSKNRLRKKLGMSPEEDIYALIQQV
ncbi:MAG TPA: hypothetical protein VFV79_03695 [Saprospiraceae bacterium]|nr:hypothetical protein [Saprospiraceae bacterium]